MRLVDLDKFPLLPNKLEGHLTEYERGYLDAQSNLNALPNVDAEPVRHGHWIIHVDELSPADSTQECSACHGEEWLGIKHENYCPNCGAKMDEVSE